MENNAWVLNAHCYLNIGLDDPQGKSMLGPYQRLQLLLADLEQVYVHPDVLTIPEVRKCPTGYFVVVEMRQLFEIDSWLALLYRMEQDCMAVWYRDLHEGTLIGSNPEAYGKFDVRFFTFPEA